jgi:hypothetical protein
LDSILVHILLEENIPDAKNPTQDPYSKTQATTPSSPEDYLNCHNEATQHHVPPSKKVLLLNLLQILLP